MKIREKEKATAIKAPAESNTANGENGERQPESKPVEGEENDEDENNNANEPEWEDDYISEDGAIWPIQGGRIVDWPCFYALMDHVYKTVNPPFHTPILLVAEPVWSSKDHEDVTQFFFERFKTPAFSMVDSAMATSYAFGVPSVTVVDVGYTKADVTCIADFVLHEASRSAAVPDCGGEAMTERLTEVLRSRPGFTRDVCDQLKRSNICEILPSDDDIPTGASAEEPATNPAAMASTGIDPAAERRNSSSAVSTVPRGPGPGTEVGEEKKLEDDEGVLDIASIVTGGNMNEYLAQKEREKAEKVAAKQQKKSADTQTGAAKAQRQPNARRLKNSFIYEDFALHDAIKNSGKGGRASELQSAIDGGNPGDISDKAAGQTAASEEITDTTPSGAFRREIEVGTERFRAASGGVLDNLADAIYRTVQGCSDINKRSELWENLIIVGNGAKVRGYKEALLARLNAKYLISPSSATMFTSELPSNFSTPIATGANTPQLQLPGQSHHSGGVNPLLLAATTAQNPHLGPSMQSSMLGQSSMHHGHTSHGQTPTSIRFAKIPEYFPEWKEVGYDEATFLGAQVAAKVLFINDGGASNGYMMRTHYNEVGPSGIHEVYL